MTEADAERRRRRATADAQTVEADAAVMDRAIQDALDAVSATKLASELDAAWKEMETSEMEAKRQQQRAVEAAANDAETARKWRAAADAAEAVSDEELDTALGMWEAEEAARREERDAVATLAARKVRDEEIAEMEAVERKMDAMMARKEKAATWPKKETAGVGGTVAAATVAAVTGGQKRSKVQASVSVKANGSSHARGVASGNGVGGSSKQGSAKAVEAGRTLAPNGNKGNATAAPARRNGG